jgi:hypothetical protein
MLIANATGLFLTSHNVHRPITSTLLVLDVLINTTGVKLLSNVCQQQLQMLPADM